MRFLSKVPAGLFLGSAALAVGLLASPVLALDVPLTVTERAGVGRVGEIVTSGVPIPKGQLASDQSAAIVGTDGQFRTLATWGDGSVKWLQCTFPVTVAANDTRTFRLVSGGGDAAPGDLVVSEGGGTVTVTTGPLRFTMKTAGFNLFDQVWLDTNGDGSFAPAERIVSSRSTSGSVVEDRSGSVFTSGQGSNLSLAVEEAGPLRAVIRFAGTHGGAAGSHLSFSGRVYAHRGRSDVVVQYSHANLVPTDVVNGQPLARWREGRGDHGGTHNSLWMEDLSVVTRVNLGGNPRYALQGAPGSAVRSGALTQDAWLYQDSSGGPWWFVSEGTTMSGFELRDGAATLATGARAQGFADVNDGLRGLTVAIRHFWENFPNKVMVSPDGTVTVGVMPRDFADPYEHRPGERKTHWSLFYFHGGDAASAQSADVAGAFQSPLRAMASADWYSMSGALGDFVPYDAGEWFDYEVHNEAAAHGFLDKREDSDFWGWQDFGDLWSDFEGGGEPPNTNRAANNLEYDSGYAFVLQALRTAGRHDELSDTWWSIAESGNEHQADIDVYHVQEGPLHWVWGGMWTHTSHGSSGRSDPHRGASPNLAHSWNRGMLNWYYLTGDRNVLDAALKVGESVTWRVENGPGGPGYSNTTGEARAPGHALEVLTDMYLHTWDVRYRDAARKLVDESHAATKDFIQSPFAGSWDTKPWMIAILMKSLGRWVHVMQEERGVIEPAAIGSLLAYAEFLDQRCFVDRVGGDPAYLHYEVFGDGSASPGGMNVNMWTARGSDALTWAYRWANGPTKRDRYRWMAQQSFEDGARYPWCHTCPSHEYTQAKVHQVLASSGQEWMVEAGPVGPGDTEPPAAITDLAAATGRGEGEVDLAWTAPGDDGQSGRAASYVVRVLDRAIVTEADWTAATGVAGAPAPGSAGTRELMTAGGLAPGRHWWFAVRARDEAGNVAALSNSPGAEAARDRTPPDISNVGVRETAPGVLTFTWDTDEPATSVVKWDQRNPGQVGFDHELADELLVTSHRVVLSGLRAGTTVWYRVWSLDAAGNGASGPLLTIQVTLTDLTPPAVTALGATVGGDGASVLVVWRTSEPADGRVEWGTTPAYGESSALSPELVTDHVVSLGPLGSGTPIHYRVRTRDAAGAEAVSDDHTFTPTTDGELPRIEDLEVTFTDSQASFDFGVSEPAHGTIRWGRAAPNEHALALGSADAPAMAHGVVLPGLERSVTYRWMISLTDPSGNGSVRRGDFRFDGPHPRDTTPPRAPGGLAVESWAETAGVRLRWSPNAEVDLAGYRIYRRPADREREAGDWVGLTGMLLAEATFVDTQAADFAREYSVTAEDAEANESAFSAALRFDPASWGPDVRLSNRPNPFGHAGGTTIAFSAPAGSSGPLPARLAVYDVTGRRVRMLFRARLAPGEARSVHWDGKDGAGRPVSAGVYWARLTLGTETTRHARMVILR